MYRFRSVEKRVESWPRRI